MTRRRGYLAALDGLAREEELADGRRRVRFAGKPRRKRWPEERASQPDDDQEELSRRRADRRRVADEEEWLEGFIRLRPGEEGRRRDPSLW